jgi:hypothetical protein
MVATGVRHQDLTALFDWIQYPNEGVHYCSGLEGSDGSDAGLSHLREPDSRGLRVRSVCSRAIVERVPFWRGGCRGSIADFAYRERGVNRIAIAEWNSGGTK